MADWPQPALKTKKPGALCWLAALLAGYTVCLLFAVAGCFCSFWLLAVFVCLCLPSLASCLPTGCLPSLAQDQPAERRSCLPELLTPLRCLHCPPLPAAVCLLGVSVSVLFECAVAVLSGGAGGSGGSDGGGDKVMVVVVVVVVVVMVDKAMVLVLGFLA